MKMSKKVDVDLKVTDDDLKKAMNPHELEMQEIKRIMSDIKHKVIVCSGKGGVGKTTVAVNLAMSLASRNLNVGILDVDITGPNVPKMLNMEGQRPEVVPGNKKFIPIKGPLNLKVMSMAFLLETPDTPVIWRGPLKMQAIRQFIAEGEWGKLDYLVVDLPPGTSDETLDILQLVDGGVIIVTTPQEVATLDSRKTVNMAVAMKKDVIGIVENMSGFTVECPKCGDKHTYDLFGSGGGELASKELNVPLVGKIPIEQGVREQGDAGVPFISKYPDSESAKAFNSIVDNIVKFMDK
jgi:ATP-binding protein involved in chromosome partitioning